MLPTRRVLRCLCAPVHQCGYCCLACGEICCEVVKNPAFLVVFIILSIHSTILVCYFTFASNAKPQAAPPKPNPLNAIVALPEYSVYLPVVNGSSAKQIGSEDFKFPLLVDMVQLVGRVRRGLKVQPRPINRPELRFVLNEQRLCQSRPELLLVVKSALRHFEQRRTIRETWGNLSCWGGRRVRRVFMVGSPAPKEPAAADTLRRLSHESRAHRDLVQADFADHYHNNTLKMMASFRWLVAHCHRAKFAFFLDDDYLVHPRNSLQFVDSISEEAYASTMSGFVWRNAAPVRRAPKRSLSKRWIVSLREYPWATYPPYVSAGAFIVSMPIIQDFNIAMEYTRYLRFDDVFLGILMHKLRITPLHADRIYSFHALTPKSPAFGGMIASHGYAVSERMRAAWGDILNRTGVDHRLLECVLSM